MTGQATQQNGPKITTHTKEVPGATQTTQTPTLGTNPRVTSPGGERQIQKEIDNTPVALQKSIEAQLKYIKEHKLEVDTKIYEEALKGLNEYVANNANKPGALSKVNFTKTQLYNRIIDAIAITQAKLLSTLVNQCSAQDQQRIQTFLKNQGFADGKFPGADFARNAGESDKDYYARMHAAADVLVGRRHGPTHGRYENGLLEKFHKAFFVEADRSGQLVPKLRKDPLVPGSCGKQMVVENAYIITAIDVLKTTTMTATSTSITRTGAKLKPMGELPADDASPVQTTAPTGGASVEQYNTGDLARNPNKGLDFLPLILGAFIKSPIGKKCVEICWPNSNFTSSVPFTK